MSQAVMTLDASRVREGFGHYPSGVSVLAATVDSQDQILVVSSLAVGISLSPPLILFAVQHSSSTWPGLRRAQRIGVSVLSQHQGPLCRQLSSKNRDERTTGVDLRRHVGGAVEVAGNATWMECRIQDEHRAGDHDIVVLEVLAISVNRDVEPLVFQGSRFRPLA